VQAGHAGCKSSMVMRTTRLTTLVVAGLVGATTGARADVFAFKDLDGFTRCMQLDHLVETLNTPNGAQHRLLEQSEIQQRCIASAVKLLAKSKSKDTYMDFINVVKHSSYPQRSVDLISGLVDVSLPSCNDMPVYGVLTRALSDAPAKDNPYYERTKSIVKRCLKDKDFKKDFLEEIDSSSKYTAENACAILLEEKLLKSCKKSKP
jgi:hypothetical protein